MKILLSGLVALVIVVASLLISNTWLSGWIGASIYMSIGSYIQSSRLFKGNLDEYPITKNKKK